MIGEEPKSMKVAFAVWEKRIAPVFDTCRELVVVSIEDGRIKERHGELILADSLVAKALRLREIGIDILICGAISKPFHEVILSYDIKIRACVVGDINDVVAAWRDDRLGVESSFKMMGCCKKMRYREEVQGGEISLNSCPKKRQNRLKKRGK
jgi:predicted Fe-Mo cluster-binding NifX family protein